MRLAFRMSLLAVVMASIVGWGVILPSRGVPQLLVASSAPQATAAATQEPAGAPMDTALFRNIARRQNPTVVAILTQVRVQPSSSFSDDDFFRQFFGRRLPQPESRVQRGVGSGVLISRTGEILTNNHVVAGAEMINVGLLGEGSRTYRATVVGRDPLSDSALIKLQQLPPSVAVATLGDSDALEPGDWVMAIGNPFQLGHTVTIGVVSYQGRPFEVSEGRWQRMIQTDASINPGNSGGPLLNVRGEVVGINAAILGGATGGNIGIGFAVPINTVKALLPQLRQGKVVRGRIGVQVRSGLMDDDEARALGLTRPGGAIVTAIERGSAADRGGLQAGDVIVDVNGRPMVSADELVPLVSSTAPGTRLNIRVMRKGQERSLTVTVEEMVLDDGRAASTSGGRADDFGLVLEDVTASIARQLRLPQGFDGAVVDEVAGGSPADRAGFEPGDVVREVNRREVHTAAQARAELQRIQTGQPVFVLVWREGREVFVQMRKD